MEDASALHAAQRCASRPNTAREAVRLHGADHERIPALLRSTWEGRCSPLRGSGEGQLPLRVPSTQVLRHGVPLREPPTNRGFAPRVRFRLKTSWPFRAKTPHQKPVTRRKPHHLWGIFLFARSPMSRHILDGYSTATCCRCPGRSGSAGRNFGVGGLPSFAVTFVSFCNIVTAFFSRHPEKQKRMDI